MTNDITVTLSWPKVGGAIALALAFKKASRDIRIGSVCIAAGYAMGKAVN